MGLRKTAAIYALIVGLAIIGVWIILLVTGQDTRLQNELRTIPFEIGMAITSDMLTAIMLLVAGFGLIKKYNWAIKVFLLSMGFLFYSVVNAVGLYGQRGEVPFIIMFGVILMLAVTFTTFALTKKAF